MLKIVIVLGAIAIPGWADDPVTQQQKAVAAMAESLAAQRAAIARQLGQKSTGSFFLLDPPAMVGLPLAAPQPSNPTAGSPINRPPGMECDPLAPAEIAPLIEGAARRESLQPELLRSVIRQESAFRPCAVSPKGAMGLMQLMPGTAAQLGVKDPFDPKENVDAGARLLKQLLNAYKDLPMALGAYNAGPGRVNEAGGVPQIPETLNYIQRILSMMPIQH